MLTVYPKVVQVGSIYVPSAASSETAEPEMAGFSVTLLKLDDELTRLWDAPVHTPALRWGS